MTKRIILLSSISLILSCTEKEFEDYETPQLNQTNGKFVNIDYKGQKMTVFKDFNNNYIMDDDIVLYEKDVKELITNEFAKNSKTSEWETVRDITVDLWPTSQLSYRIDPSIPNSQKQLILQSVAEWNNKTNIKFSETSSNENVYFRKVDSGCNASLGYQGNNQKNTVNLSQTCDKQSIIHEIGHVIGMIHEHQRENRNNYITLKPDTYLHIKNNYSSSLYNSVIYNLQIERSSLLDPFSFDIQSVMMYGSYPRNHIPLRDDLMSRNLPLYTKKDGSIVNRPILGLTSKDVQWTNYHYNNKLILKNIDYNVVRVKIRLEGTGDPNTISFNPGDEIALIYDKSKNKYTYNGYIVQQLDLNNGSASDDIHLSWTLNNNITYTANQNAEMTLIKDYTTPNNNKFYHLTDSDGIDNGGRNAIVETIKKDNFTTYINLKRWNSTASTDGKNHSFNRNTSTQLIIRNINYPTLQRIKMRLKSCGDKTISLSPGQSATIQYTGSNFEYNGCILQEIDFNNGGSSDDLSFDWSNRSREITYRASDNYTTTIIDTNSGYIYGTVDSDGIDGKDGNAQLDSYISNGKMYIDIKK